MQTPIKTLITATLALFIISCNSAKKDKEATDKPAADTAVATTAPPPTDDTAVAPAAAVAKKCFSNDGLKYTTTVTINFEGSKVSGTVTSEDMGSGKKETDTFDGIAKGDKLTVKFKGKAPVVGDASEWTTKPWTITQGTSASATSLATASSPEKLVIVFNAKNYETNKWGETGYEFALSNCK